MTTQRIPISGEHLTEFRKPFERIEELERENAALRAALQQIASPLAGIKANAESGGHQLSPLAYQIANDPEHLKGIAAGALAFAALAREKTNG